MIFGCKTSIIPNGVKIIGDSAFNGCTGLLNIAIPEGVISIGNTVFQNCDNLSFVVIPTSVEKIGNFIFGNYVNINIYYEGTETDWEKIDINENNEHLKSPYLYYYCEEKPDVLNKYWYYDNGIPTIWTVEET